MGWTLAFIMASTGCGGGCSCGPACSFDPEFNCAVPSWTVPADAQFPDLGVIDAAPSDGSLDGMLESMCPGVGDPCTMATGCPLPEALCLEPAFFGTVGLGGPSDPIQDHPDGEDTFVPTPLFPGGYCTTSWPGSGPDQCNVRGEGDVDPVCGACASCIDLFGLDTEENPDDFVPGFCARRCTPRVGSSECRAGYECLMDLEVCSLGCQSDDECRISREDGNGVEGIQTPFECEESPEVCRPPDCEDPEPADPEGCANPSANFDGLVYDLESGAICDELTARCVGAFDPVAVAGDPCTEDDQCERLGRCIAEAEDGSWAGGTCTKERCDIDGNECAEGGVCATVERDGIESPACFAACTVGGYDAADPESWIGERVAQAECRDGYDCEWLGRGAGDEPANGACLPSSYPARVGEPNVGQPCDVDADCWSPFGYGVCLQNEGFPEGYCSVRSCFAPWLTEGAADATLCGADAVCVPFDLTDPTSALCVQRCTEAEECEAGLGCLPLGAEGGACWIGCTRDADCRSGERCSMVDTEDARCVPE